MKQDLLKVENLRISYENREGKKVPVVSDVSFRVKRSEIVGVVGESGSGKTQLSLSLIHLLSEEAFVSSDEMNLDGQELSELDEEALCKVRGNKISMVFQEPMTSLNPVFTIGYQVKEAISAHREVSSEKLEKRALELLDMVKIPDSARRMKEYPHELSGGLRQRVMIAMALASEADLLIADEPTTALDVTTQAGILDLLGELQEKTGFSVLFVTHDLGIVAELCDYVLVMYAGKIVEKGSAKSIFTNPSHPYTRSLLDAVPRLGKRWRRPHFFGASEEKELKNSQACSFSSRCEFKKEDPCLSKIPPLQRLDEGHASACFFADSLPKRDEDL